MAAKRSQIKVKGMMVAGDAEPAIAEATTGALTGAVFLHHREHIPRHFENGAKSRYSYMPRKGDLEGPSLERTSKKGVKYTVANWHYSWRKRKKKHHNRPLVWTGASEQAAKMYVRVKIKATGKRQINANGILNLPKYFYQYGKRSDGTNSPNKWAELKATTPDERSALIGYIRTNIPAHLRKRAGRTVTERV